MSRLIWLEPLRARQRVANCSADLVRITSGLCREQRRTIGRGVSLEMTDRPAKEVCLDTSKHRGLCTATRDAQLLQR